MTIVIRSLRFNGYLFRRTFSQTTILTKKIKTEQQVANRYKVTFSITTLIVRSDILVAKSSPIPTCLSRIIMLAVG